MEKAFRPEKLERLIVRDEKFIFTAISYLMILAISLNSAFILSKAVGMTASIVYLMINTLFLENTLFQREILLIRLLLGCLVLLSLLGIAGWAILTAYKLDTIAIAITLCIVAGISSVVNRMKARRKSGEPK